MNLNLDLKSAHDLKFIGEGNEHIVLVPALSGCALRFRKNSPKEKIRREDLVLQVTDDLNFNNEVARPLAGCLMVDESQMISLDSFILQTVMKRIQSIRDEKRLCKDINEYGIGIMTANFATEFIPRKLPQRKEIFPEILSFTLKDEIITVFSSVFPFSESRTITDNSTNLIEINSGKKLKSSAVDYDDKTVKSSIHPEAKPIHQEREESQSSRDVLSDSATDSGISQGNGKDTERENGNQDKTEPSQLLCIELKPKQGYLEKGPFGNNICRFCLKQFLKLETGAEAVQSLYCPQSLFSGDECLMKEALQNLFTCPQNNLKLFANGKRIKELKKYRNLCDVIQKILTYKCTSGEEESDNYEKTSDDDDDVALKPPSSPPANCSIQEAQLSTTDAVESSSISREDPSSDFEKELQRKKLVCSSEGLRFVPLFPEGHALPVQSYLARVLYLQAFGQLSECDAASLYRELIARIPCEVERHRQLSEFEFLKESRKKSFPTRDFQIFKYRNETSGFVHYQKATEVFRGSLDRMNTSTICQLVQECLVSMSAKDVSLMMLIDGPHKKCDEKFPGSRDVVSPFWIESPECEGQWYKCQVSLVDLALKNPKKILEHEVALGNLEQILIRLRSEGKQPKCCKA